jgi:uncharacterized protein YtpQ (UPF0354 family)
MLIHRMSVVVCAIAAVLLGPAFLAPDAGPMTMPEFAAQAAAALRVADPQARVDFAQEGVLGVETQGWTGTILLAKAYELYRRDPASLASLLDGVVRSHLETVKTSRAAASADVKAKLLPVVRSKAWFETSQQRARDAGADPEKTLGSAIVLNPALLLLLVEDRPASVRFLSAADIESLGLSAVDARHLALQNLAQLRRKMKIEGRDGRYRVTGDLQYESSLALDEPFLRGAELSLDGDPVVAIPAPGILYVTGAKNRESVESLRAVAQKLYQEAGPRGISPALFVWRQGQLQPVGVP